MTLINFLRWVFPNEDLGWKPIGEIFYRYDIVKCRWFNIYLHELTAMTWHPKCHDHPWWFWTLLLWNGYLEENDSGLVSYHAGQLLYRPANYVHNVVTPNGTSWSLILTGPKSRKWGFKDCRLWNKGGA
jgi:hypothetical protein